MNIEAERLENPDISARKTTVLADLLASRLSAKPISVLVVGCGTGHEAGFFAYYFSANIVGIDIAGVDRFDHTAAAPAVLRVMDAQAMEFPDESFDIVYSFHALEHIAKPEVALREMSRVLRRGGTYCVGTPNKARLIGYIGSSEGLYYKVLWNFTDLRMRLAGKWRNDAGAHAGFTQEELLDLCRQSFGDAAAITNDYYQKLYGSDKGIGNAALAAVLRSPLRRYLLPCVYILGRKL